jgi:hypothetical protein
MLFFHEMLGGMKDNILYIYIIIIINFQWDTIRILFKWMKDNILYIHKLLLLLFNLCNKNIIV